MNSEKKSSKYWDNIVPTKNLVKDYLAKAKEDLEVSKRLFLQKDYDWSFSIAYNSILQSSRALMAFNKVRSRGPSHHISIIRFLKEFYGSKLEEDFIFLLNKFRKKRHLAVYGVGDIISEKECDFCIQICENFIKKVKEILNDK